MDTKKLNIFLVVVIIGLLALLCYVFSTRDFKNQDQGGQALTVPVIVFSGFLDGISENEKQELENKLLNPFIDWNTENYPPSRPVSIVVEKTNSTYWMYNVQSIGQGGTTDSFAYGEKDGEIPLWVPDCIDGGCVFTKSFSEKYPEVVAEYNKKDSR